MDENDDVPTKLPATHAVASSATSASSAVASAGTTDTKHTGSTAITTDTASTTPAPRKFASPSEEMAFLRAENERLRKEVAAFNLFNVPPPLPSAFGLPSNALPKVQKYVFK
jgi:hypothetical protein